MGWDVKIPVTDFFFPCTELSACSKDHFRQLGPRLHFSPPSDNTVQGDHGPRLTAALDEPVLVLK